HAATIERGGGIELVGDIRWERFSGGFTDTALNNVEGRGACGAVGVFGAIERRAVVQAGRHVVDDCLNSLRSNILEEEESHRSGKRLAAGCFSGDIDFQDGVSGQDGRFNVGVVAGYRVGDVSGRVVAD